MIRISSNSLFWVKTPAGASLSGEVGREVDGRDGDAVGRKEGEKAEDSERIGATCAPDTGRTGTGDATREMIGAGETVRDVVASSCRPATEDDGVGARATVAGVLVATDGGRLNTIPGPGGPMELAPADGFRLEAVGGDTF